MEGARLLLEGVPFDFTSARLVYRSAQFDVKCPIGRESGKDRTIELYWIKTPLCSVLDASEKLLGLNLYKRLR